MRSITEMLIKNKLIMLDSNVMKEDIELLEEYERISRLSSENEFNEHLYYNILEWMRDNEMLRDQIKMKVDEIKSKISAKNKLED